MTNKQSSQTPNPNDLSPDQDLCAELEGEYAEIGRQAAHEAIRKAKAAAAAQLAIQQFPLSTEEAGYFVNETLSKLPRTANVRSLSLEFFPSSPTVANLTITYYDPASDRPERLREPIAIHMVAAAQAAAAEGKATAPAAPTAANP